jgi:protoporphyrinogen oxidase
MILFFISSIIAKFNLLLLLILKKKQIKKPKKLTGTAIPQPKKIAIIGGGILGLTTAYYLNRLLKEKAKLADSNNVAGGIDVAKSVKVAEGAKVAPFVIDVYEKSSQVGGLAETYFLPGLINDPLSKKDSAGPAGTGPAGTGPAGTSPADTGSSGTDPVTMDPAEPYKWPFVEKYYHHFFASDKALQKLLKELGIFEKLKWYDAKMGIFVNNQPVNFSTALDILKFPPLGFFNRIRLGIVSFILQKWPSNNGFAKVTAIKWCQKYFGKTVTSLIWQPLLESKFSDDYNKVSMLWLRSRIKDRSSSRPSLFAEERLGYINGSLETLISAIQKDLETEGVKFNTDVSNVSLQWMPENKTSSQTVSQTAPDTTNNKNSKPIHPKRKKHIIKSRKPEIFHRLKFTTNDKQLIKDYDIVIATVPPKEFIRDFSPPVEYNHAISKIKFIGAICLTLILKKQFMPYYWLTINDPKEPFIAVIEHTNLISENHYNGKHILYLGKYLEPKDNLYTMEEDQLRQLVEKFLFKLNPHFDPSWIESISVQRTHTAQHIVDTKYQPAQAETGKKGLYYAHFSQIYPHDRGVNYAIEQGSNLAQLINKQWTS